MISPIGLEKFLSHFVDRHITKVEQKKNAVFVISTDGTTEWTTTIDCVHEEWTEVVTGVNDDSD